jgi:hypothetical protein
MTQKTSTHEEEEIHWTSDDQVTTESSDQTSESDSDSQPFNLDMTKVMKGNLKRRMTVMQSQSQMLFGS